MAELNSAMGMTSSAYGYYAQAQSGTDFDGSQLKNRLDDILAAGGVFQPAMYVHRPPATRLALTRDAACQREDGKA